jgi:phosphoribosyl 1,2-cyclic phosphodiesterase
MAVDLCMLGSGSTGNSLFLKGGNTRILIDAGLSCLQIKKRLKTIGESLADIQAIIITHEHADHMRGIGVICRQYETPVYLTPSTRDQANQYFLFNGSLRSFDGNKFRIGDLRIEAFPVPHDAADPVGFRISDGQVRVVVATDIGQLNAEVIGRFCGAHFVVLEANHDPDMLENGPYPRHLKRRIAGPEGHLANEDAGKAIAQSFTPQLYGVMLAHLSRFNNTPELALKTVSEQLKVQGLSPIPIHLSYHDRPSSCIEITKKGARILIEPDYAG